ncbi:MAG: FAD-dependent oxidoreductase, partial [Acidobacteria bacterium]|nr:FAD-dependent oxidoreductase [Acidobacteriota bacterium]
DAVVVAIGAHKSLKSDIPGIDSEGVTGCVDFLRSVNLGEGFETGKRVVVLGGGNAAFDSARVARRLGAEQVHLCCIESRPAMPASRDEIKQGEEEGVRIHPSKTATEILCENGRVKGVAFQDVDAFYFEEDGTIELEVAEDSESRMDADTVILAVGQEPDVPESFDLDLSEKNRIEVEDYTSETSMEGVYAAGDAVHGASALIGAIASGRRCATAVDIYLGGSGLIDEKLAPASEPDPGLGPDKEFAFMDRCEPVCVAPEERVTSFCKVDQGLEENTADYESGRCLQCDLRMKIATVKVWGSY